MPGDEALESLALARRTGPTGSEQLPANYFTFPTHIPNCCAWSGAGASPERGRPQANRGGRDRSPPPRWLATTPLPAR